MTKRIRYTLEQEYWLRDNYHKSKSYDELTSLFNKTFGVNRKKRIYTRKMY